MATAKSTPKITEKISPVDDAPTDAVKVQVRSTPPVSDAASDVSTKADLTVHHELTITPISEASEPQVDVETSAATPETIETEVPDTAKPAVVEPVKPAVTMPLESPKPPVDDAPKTEPQPNSNQVEPKPGEMQSPKVFDTKQYHLPIDEGAAGSKGKSVMIFFVVLLLLVVGAVVAIDAGWVDVGFDLPFDLIK